MKPLHSRRPVDFKEWRALWWESLREVGMLANHQLQNGRVVMDRDLWQSMRRSQRLFIRVKVEADARTESFMRTSAEALLAEIRNRQQR